MDTFLLVTATIINCLAAQSTLCIEGMRDIVEAERLQEIRAQQSYDLAPVFVPTDKQVQTTPKTLEATIHLGK